MPELPKLSTASVISILWYVSNFPTRSWYSKNNREKKKYLLFYGQIDGSTGETLTYLDFKRSVNSLATIFRNEFNVVSGSSVLICSNNNVLFNVPLYAASAAGALVYSIPSYSHG